MGNKRDLTTDRKGQRNTNLELFRIISMLYNFEEKLLKRFNIK